MSEREVFAASLLAVGDVVRDDVLCRVASNVYDAERGEGQLILQDCNGCVYPLMYRDGARFRRYAWSEDDWRAFVAS